MTAWRMRLRAGSWRAAALIGASVFGASVFGAGPAPAEEAAPPKAAETRALIPHRAVYAGEAFLGGLMEMDILLEVSIGEACGLWRNANNLVMRPRGGLEGSIATFERSEEAMDGSSLRYETGMESKFIGLDARPETARGDARPGGRVTVDGRSVKLPQDVVFYARASEDLAQALARGEKRIRRKLFTPPPPGMGATDPVMDLVVEISPAEIPPEEREAFGPEAKGRKLWRAVSRAWEYSGADGPPLFESRDLVAEGGLLLATEMVSGEAMRMNFALKSLELLEPEPCDPAKP